MEGGNSEKFWGSPKAQLGAPDHEVREAGDVNKARVVNTS